MAKFYLLNTVIVGTTKFLAGAHLDEDVHDTAGVEAEGGVLWDETDTKVSAAAVIVTKLRTRGADEALCNSIMIAAAVSSGEAVTAEDLASTAANKGASLIGVRDAGLFLSGATVEAVLAELAKDRVRHVRGVVFANVADLNAFTVAGNDGLTYVEGQRVLLANQTTAAQCGIYVVGAVGGGTAPLTRAPDMAATQAIENGMIVEVSEGTIFAGSTWKAMCTGAKVVGTDDPLFYPRVCKGQLTLVAGTKTLGAAEGLFLFSTTKSQWHVQFVDQGGTMTGTNGYKVASAGRTAGKSGTAAAIVIAHVEAGTIQNQDASVLDWQVTNW